MKGLLYKASPNGCQHRLQILLRLRPYPMRGDWLLFAVLSMLRALHLTLGRHMLMNEHAVLLQLCA